VYVPSALELFFLPFPLLFGFTASIAGERGAVVRMSYRSILRLSSTFVETEKRLAGWRILQSMELRISRDPVFSLVLTAEPDTGAISRGIT